MAAIVLVGSCGYLALGVTRGDLGGTPGLAGLAWPALALLGATLAWAWLVHTVPTAGPDRVALAAAIAARLAVWPRPPNLSDDVWRYLWDGRLLAWGRDPYEATPHELVARAPQLAAPLGDLLPRLNSPDYTSVYPPVAQVPNLIAATLATDATSQALVLKALALGADLATVALLLHLARRWQLPRAAPWVYALSPLAVLELAGQAHTEALAIPLLLLSLLLLDQGRAAHAGAALALAIGAKLLPALALPFLPRRLPAGSRLPFVLALTAGLLVILLPVVVAGDLPDVLGSLRLYVRLFAFNDLLHGLAARVLGAQAGVVLAALSALVVLALAAAESHPTPRSLARALAFGWGAWLLLATTIHPWYVTPLLALGSLGGLRFPAVWAAWIPTTYATYWVTPGPAEVEVLVAAQGVTVIAVLGADLLRAAPDLPTLARGGGLLRALVAWTLPPRARLKRDLLLPLLDPGHVHLDVGCGTGALTAALRAEGLDVLPLDVRDASFQHDVRPVLYDGRRLPFADGAVDTVLLVTVLHHTRDPDALLSEARRVARARVVVMEDVWTSEAQRRLTLLVDRLVNLELTRPAHSNRDEAGWARTFAGLGLPVLAARPRRTAGLFRQIVYVLDARGGGPGEPARSG